MLILFKSLPRWYTYSLYYLLKGEVFLFKKANNNNIFV